MIKFFLFFFSIYPAYAELVDRTVAIVNTEIVLESDIRMLDKKVGKPGLIDESLLFDKPISALKGNRKEQLEYLINDRILRSEIKKLNYTVTNDRIESELKDMAKRNGVSVPELLNIIKGQGLSASEYKSFLKDSIEKRSLLDAEIVSKLRISDEDALNEYLKANPNSRPSIDEFGVAHVFLSPKKGGAEAALRRAEVILKKLRKGESFDKLAQQFSEDPNFSPGGFLGTFKSGDFLPEIEQSISNLKVGETTQIVRSRMGFHIVKLTSKKLTTDPRFEKAKDRIKAQLLDESFRRQLKTWIQSKRDESFIRLND